MLTLICRKLSWGENVHVSSFSLWNVILDVTSCFWVNKRILGSCSMESDNYLLLFQRKLTGNALAKAETLQRSSRRCLWRCLLLVLAPKLALNVERMRKYRPRQHPSQQWKLSSEWIKFTCCSIDGVSAAEPLRGSAATPPISWLYVVCRTFDRSLNT